MSSPARRTVLKAFGQWLDFAEWKARVQAGLEDPPKGDDIADMARSVIALEERYHDLARQYIDDKAKES